MFEAWGLLSDNDDFPLLQYRLPAHQIVTRTHKVQSPGSSICSGISISPADSTFLLVEHLCGVPALLGGQAHGEMTQGTGGRVHRVKRLQNDFHLFLVGTDPGHFQFRQRLHLQPPAVEQMLLPALQLGIDDAKLDPALLGPLLPGNVGQGVRDVFQLRQPVQLPIPLSRSTIGPPLALLID